MLGKKRKTSEETKVFFISKPTHEIQSAIISNKPLWISEVSASVKRIFPIPIQAKDFEQIKELMQTDTSVEHFDTADYPYYLTIKKIMYVFGDCYQNNPDTVMHMHDFIREFLLSLGQLLSECDFKKIIDHFFSYEYEKIHNYKRLKFKNSFISGGNEELTGDELKLSAVDLNGGTDSNVLFCNEDEAFNLDSNDNHKQRYSRKEIEVDNAMDEKDEHYAENIIFQSERTEMMDTNQYLEYYSCRQHGFLTKGKKAFTDYLQALFGVKCPVELKDNSNIELIAFILKEEIKKIVIEAIKSKNCNKKLFVLNYPLTVDDIENLCQEEIAKLEDFLNAFHSNVALMKQFLKKPFSDKSQQHNRYVKVKKTNKGVYIIIKKHALVEGGDERFKRIQKNAEAQVLIALQMLKGKLIKLKDDKVKGTDCRLDKLNFINGKGEEITVKELVSFLGISDYYQYFLIKDNLFSLLIKGSKVNTLASRISLLGKVTRKEISNKFYQWLQMTIEERRGFITQFNQLLNDEEDEGK